MTGGCDEDATGPQSLHQGVGVGTTTGGCDELELGTTTGGLDELELGTTAGGCEEDATGPQSLHQGVEDAIGTTEAVLVGALVREVLLNPEGRVYSIFFAAQYSG